MCMVAVVQILSRDGPCAARALGHVLAGHFDMDATRMCAFRAMDREESFHFLENTVERTRLVTTRSDRVAMHRIARPYHLTTFLLDGADQLRQMIANLIVAKARNQCQASCLVFRIEKVD